MSYETKEHLYAINVNAKYQYQRALLGLHTT